jgi:hypothetical protein
MKADKYLGFAEVVARYEAKRTWRDREEMMLFADIRNLLAHRLHGLPAIPTRSTLRAIEDIWRRLNAPEIVIPRFQRSVIRVSPTDTLVQCSTLFARITLANFRSTVQSGSSG